MKQNEAFTLNAYAIIERAIEEGVALGYRRAHKHTDSPSEDALKEAISMSVMQELCEIINFDAGD